ncbi:hypothetical protein [Sphingomonas sp.]|uniref:hypothetical protein n=1 Tax=Sphingomonas sp. TaxID=28214 RepID=UPI001EB2F4E9|nr:hypothetical protein [Sphingomonas sp.]MBX3595506.1 hypothetical protein [Sphingomonas sp.]
MFVGHYAPALAVAATGRPSPRLGTLFVAAQFVDLAFFGLMLAGVEHLRIVPGITAMNPMDLYDMPWTHSLAGTCGWAVLFAATLWLAVRNWRMAAIGALVVVSHWPLDLLVHRPDLTLAGSPPAWGLGLWDHPAIEMPLETLLVAGALLFYAGRTRPRRHGRLSLAILTLAMVVVQAVNWFGPPPEAATPAIPLSALLAYGLLATLAWWTGRTREAKA